MNVRKRSGDMNSPLAVAVRNANTSRRDGKTQAAPIKNAVSAPKPTGYSKIKGAVSG